MTERKTSAHEIQGTPFDLFLFFYTDATSKIKCVIKVTGTRLMPGSLRAVIISESD